ncbi:FecR family protein [Compostibacter hankyongensis]|uniref:FecR family protein n=1 Tax=Compostibacter hankyongensis TaxID=1007089 RepID=A0ABP8FLP0_9BACT
MSANSIWRLMARKDSGDITPAERETLERMLRENEPVGAAHAFLKRILGKKLTLAEQPRDEEAGWKSLEQRLHADAGPEAGHRLRRWVMAAAAAVLVTTGLWLYFSLASPDIAKKDFRASNEVSTQPGSRSKIVLPDGTKVWLNSGSNLSYNDFSRTGIREVTLKGEAFFEVVHDEAHPFVVHASELEIRDIGTAFEVKSYPGDTQFEATLIEGAIEITDPREPERKILLKPQEKITIPVGATLQEIKKHPQDDHEETTLYTIARIKPVHGGLFPETAWVQNTLVFDNEPFAELARKMERWYNVKISFSDTVISQTRFSGIIRNETIDQAMQAMQFSVPFRYHMEGNSIRISKK